MPRERRTEVRIWLGPDFVNNRKYDWESVEFGSFTTVESRWDS